MQTRDFTELSKSIDLFIELGAKVVVMAAKEVATALQVLTSDAPLSSEEWSDGGAFEALITEYFAGRDDSDEESETSDSDRNGISLCFITMLHTLNYILKTVSRVSAISAVPVVAMQEMDQQPWNAMTWKTLVHVSLVSH